MSVLACNDADFESVVLRSDLPVLVDFWAPWCGPCKAMSPIVDELAKEFDGRLRVVKVDVADARRAAAKYGITSIPNFVVLRQGELKAQMTGARPKHTLVEAIMPHLNDMASP